MFSFCNILLYNFKIFKFQMNTAGMSHKVFVYGTLKRNEPNHHWLTNPEHGVGKFLSEGTTKTKYPLIIATKYNIPFLLYSPGDGHHVRGEVYEVDDIMLSKLDILEDHPTWYIREIEDIVIMKNDTEEVVKCWVYFLKNFRQELLRGKLHENYSSNGAHGLKYWESDDGDGATIEDINELLDKTKK